MSKVLPLKGTLSLRAYNAFHKLMLGLKMAPAYMREEYDDFFNRIEAMNTNQQRKVVAEAVRHVPLDDDELQALLAFTCDANGIPFSKENIDNLGPAEFVENIVEVCMEMAKIKPTIITEAEKKN